MTTIARPTRARNAVPRPATVCASPTTTTSAPATAQAPEQPHVLTRPAEMDALHDVEAQLAYAVDATLEVLTLVREASGPEDEKFLEASSLRQLAHEETGKVLVALAAARHQVERLLLGAAVRP